jgi:hypothetical protein
MVKNYERGDIAVFNITWLDQFGSEKIISSDVLISILKYDSGSWTTIIDEETMSLDSGSSYYYEFDTLSQEPNYDYKVIYSTTVDGLIVKSSEEFRLTEAMDFTTLATSEELASAQTNILNQIKELRHGNEKIEFFTEDNKIVRMVIKTKADSSLDWESPTSTKTLYFNYSGNTLTSVGDEI